MSNFINHIKLIYTHRKNVRNLCIELGIPLQGILHDLSKYSPTEIKLYKYYTGTSSPHNNLRKEKGYSYPWLHHKYNNKHHYQFWIDEDEDDNAIAIKMPYNYVLEMFCDRVGASKAYLKDNFTTKAPFEYYQTHTTHALIHPKTRELLGYLLEKLSEYQTMKEFITWYKEAAPHIKQVYNKEGNK